MALTHSLTPMHHSRAPTCMHVSAPRSMTRPNFYYDAFIPFEEGEPRWNRTTITVAHASGRAGVGWSAWPVPAMKASGTEPDGRRRKVERSSSLRMVVDGAEAAAGNAQSMVTSAASTGKTAVGAAGQLGRAAAASGIELAGKGVGASLMFPFRSPSLSLSS